MLIFQKVRAYFKEMFSDSFIYEGIVFIAIGVPGLFGHSFFSFIHIWSLSLVAVGAFLIEKKFEKCSILRVERTMVELTPDQARALYEATAAIYFADNSDYLCALWCVVRALSPGTADLLEKDEAAAYRQVSEAAGFKE